MGSVAKDQQLHPCDSLLLELNVGMRPVSLPRCGTRRCWSLSRNAWMSTSERSTRPTGELVQGPASSVHRRGEAELAGIRSAIASHQFMSGREELNAIIQCLKEMRTKKVERWNQFVHGLEEIKKISSEIRPSDFVPFKTNVDQSDLSLGKLEELTKELESLL